jgi:hypothetical protein
MERKYLILGGIALVSVVVLGLVFYRSYSGEGDTSEESPKNLWSKLKNVLKSKKDLEKTETTTNVLK